VTDKYERIVWAVVECVRGRNVGAPDGGASCTAAARAGLGGARRRLGR